MSDVSRFTTTAAEVLVVIDSGVADFQLLAENVMNGAALLVLDGDRDGIQQITEAQQRFGANILHIVSHGAPGCLYLGNTELSLDTLDRYTQQVKQWFGTSQEAELFLYGCHVAAGDAGSEFITKLHRLTGAKIAASKTLTGHQSLGGTWQLEYSTSNTQPALAFNAATQENWVGVLAAGDSFGTDFWVAFPRNYSSASTLQLFISGQAGTTGTVNVPGIASSQNFTIPAGGVATITVPVAAQLSDGTVKENKGVHVTTSAEVGVYGINDVTASTDAYVAFPVDALGMDYMVLTPSPTIAGYGSQVTVVGTQNNTSVTITPKGGSPTTVTLNQGEVYQFEDPADLTGTTVTASAPVSVFAGTQIVNIGAGAADFVVEQVTPISGWGTQYLVAPTLAPDRFRVLASADNTVIQVNGATVATLNKGEFYEHTANGAFEFTGSKAILVAQLIEGGATGGAANAGDPSLIYAQTPQNFLKKVAFTTPTGAQFTRHSVTVISKTADLAGIKLDGAAVATTWNQIGTSAYSWTLIPVSTGDHVLTGTSAFGATLYGDGANVSYGYTAGSNVLGLPLETPPDLVASSDTGLLSDDDITTVTTPTFSGAPGSGQAGDTVKIYADGNAVGTATVNPDGSWQVTTSTLQEGVRIITATFTTQGIEGSQSPGLNVTIDTSKPIAPSSLDLSALSDSGISDTDDITSDTTPTITGTAEPNSAVELFDNGTLLDTVTTDGSGNWTFTPTIPLIPGTHPITATATDAAGNVSPASASLPITIVATPTVPSNLDLVTPSDTGVSTTDDLTSHNTPTIVGKADPGVEVSLFDGGSLIGTAITDPSGDWTFTPSTPLGEGTHPITVKAKDGAGNLGTASSQLTVTIDTTVPAAPGSLDLIAASDDGTSDTDNITGDNTPTITGTAEPNSKVELLNGAASLGTTTTYGSGSWTFTPSSSLLVGTYSVTAKATDAAGNTSAVSAPLPLTITAPPGTPFNLDLVDASDTGASNTDNLTQDTTPTLTGKADPNTVVVVFDGPTNLGQVTANASGDWTFTPTSLADGVHPFTARQKDGAGNLGTASTLLNITIDSAAPAAPTTAPNLIDSSDTGTSKTDNITSDNTPTFDGVAPLGAATVELFSGTTSLGKAPVDGSGNWSFTPTTALTDNTYSITLKAIDAAGNSSPASPPLSVTIDALPPKVSFTPIQSNDSTPALTGKVDDPNAVVEVKINGVTYPATNKGDGTWFIPDNTIAPLTEGGFDILVTAKDKQGNSGTDNGGGGTGAGGTTKALTIDKTAPTGAILTVTPTAAGVNTVSIQFTEPVTNFDVSDLQLTRSADGVDAPVSLAGAKLTSADGGKTWALTNIAGITKLTGDYKLTVNRSDIRDLAGNGIAASATSSFRLGDDCVFGTPLAVPKLKGKKGIKKNGNGNRDNLGGGKGKDEFKGLNGNDRLGGGGGSDHLDGGQGKDALAGGTGRDLVMGGAGKDKLKGGGGKDFLMGGSGKDLLVGGNSPDILMGGAKKDILKGGRGKDMFVFNGLASEGNDLIKRFETQRDVIDLRSVFARAEFTGATPDAKFHKYIQTVQLGANTEVRVDLDGAGAGTVFGAIATLKNINASTISCSNFVVA